MVVGFKAHRLKKGFRYKEVDAAAADGGGGAKDYKDVNGVDWWGH